ncbi:antitoxin CptB [Faunimonas pinastri]|uniref:FAD assembly factor SdhE n=2 Tax=Faunimonas pinastri TaxID=1855383 RepID=A0A1H9JI34_9HYPH|nr:antitoxin CptB [Faunimonas pinastri]
MREMDLLLGGFADDRIADLTDAELDDFEALMEAPDGDLLDWFTGKVDVPETYDTQVYRDIFAFHARKADQTH